LTSCAQPGQERAKTNPVALRIAFIPFMYLSPYVPDNQSSPAFKA
jgi:hypothetical protein